MRPLCYKPWQLLDVLAPQITLRFGGKKGIRTSVGVALTVMYFAALMVFAYMIVYTYTKTDSPTVVVENIEEVNTHNVSLSASKLMPILFVLKDEVTYISPADVPKYFTIVMTKYKFRNTIDASGNNVLSLGKVVMPVVPCSQLKQNKPDLFEVYKDTENDPLYQRLGDKFALCVQHDPNEAYISGSGNNPDSDVMIYQIFPCMLGASCAPLSDLTRISVVPAMPATTLTLSDYNQPKKSTLQFDTTIYVNEALKQKYQIRFASQELLDDFQSLNNLFQGKTVKEKYFFLDKSLASSNMRPRSAAQISCTYAEISTGICQAYIHLEMITSSKSVRTTRLYKSLTKTVSEIGGIHSILFVVFFYINLLYCHFARKNILVDEVFTFLRRPDSQGGLFGRCKKKKVSPAEEPSTSSNSPKIPAEDLVWLRKKAYNSIIDSLDVVNIVKELHLLKVLTKVLLKDHHVPLGPMLALHFDDPIQNINMPEPVNNETRQAFMRKQTNHDFFEAWSQLKHKKPEGIVDSIDSKPLETKVEELFSTHLLRQPGALSVGDVEGDNFTPTKLVDPLKSKKPSMQNIQNNMGNPSPFDPNQELDSVGRLPSNQNQKASVKKIMSRSNLAVSTPITPTVKRNTKIIVP